MKIRVVTAGFIVASFMAWGVSQAWTGQPGGPNEQAPVVGQVAPGWYPAPYRGPQPGWRPPMPGTGTLPAYQPPAWHYPRSPQTAGGGVSSTSQVQLQVELDSVRRQLYQAREDMKFAQTLLREARGLLSQSHAASQRDLDQLRMLNDQLVLMAARYDVAQRETLRLQSELETARLTLSQRQVPEIVRKTAQKLQEKLQAELGNVTDQFHTEQEKTKSLVVELDKAKADLVQLNRQHSESQQQTLEAVRQAEQNLQEKFQADLEGVTSQYQAEQAKTKSLVVELDKAKADLERIETQYSEGLKEEKTAQQSQTDLQDITTRYQAAQAREEKLSGELDVANVVLSGNLERLESQKVNIGELEKERNVLQQKLTKSEARIALFSRQLTDVLSELSDLKTAAIRSGKKVDGTDPMLDACRTKLSAMESDLNTMGRASTDLEQSLKKISADRDVAQAQLDACIGAGVAAKKEALAPSPIMAVSASKPGLRVVDTDGDDVPDNIDLCKQTPGGVMVDSAGCRLDLPMSLTLEGVQFRYDSHELTGGSHAILDSIAQTLKQDPTSRYEVAGHTDSQGNATYNEWLSLLRAREVRKYLISMGIGASKLTAHGYGSQQPVADNSTREGLRRNRRVELRRQP